MHPPKAGTLAQSVEQRTENPCVPGSIPGGTTERKATRKCRFFCFLIIITMFFVYVIYSDTIGRKYIGQTEDLERRINEHNNGLLGVYTKNKGPWRLVYFEQYQTRSEAMKREKELKTGKGRDFLKTTIGY